MESQNKSPEPVARTPEQKLQKLARHREAKEVSEIGYNSNSLRWLVEMGQPLDRKDLETHSPQALVLTYDEFQQIGPFDVVLASGNVVTLDPDNFPENDVLILYPWDLGA